MASVALRFSPPAMEDLTKLIIFESTAADGSYGEIEQVTSIGTYPDYIDNYTTDDAASASNWFAIQWEDSKGARTDISNPLQGGTDTFVGEIMSLVEERDPNLDTQTVRQETEFAIETLYGRDPYMVQTEDTNYRQRIGLARLVQARTMLNKLATSTSSGTAGSGWVAGLVSMKSSSGTQSDNESMIRWLLEDAARMLGFNYARVAQMATMVIAGGMSAYEIAFPEPILIAVE